MLLSEYGGEIDYWLARPFAQIFALYAAIRARYGGEAGGPTYADRALLRALESKSPAASPASAASPRRRRRPRSAKVAP